jgi:hypothetical protein
MRMRIVLTVAAVLLVAAASASAAPIEHEGRISDVFAFRSYDGGATPRVTLILCADPLEESGEGPGWRPFDPEVLYEIKIDNDEDTVADIVFRFRFATEQRLPNILTAYFGAGAGVVAPANSPAPVPPGTLIVPPKIASFSSPGLGQRQAYTVTMIKGGVATPITGVGPFFAVPPNAGPRTVDYDALFAAAINTTTLPSVRVFAGNVDDPSFGDRGAFFDTLNTPTNAYILSPVEDAQLANGPSDTLSGFAVNAIAIEVPVSLITRTGAVEAASSPAATIGVWGSTARPRLTVRRAPLPPQSAGAFSQVDRRGNPLTSELLIGTAFKQRFALDQPKNDAQFSAFFLDPLLARTFNAVTAGALAIPTPPRVDLLPLLTYAPPIAAPGTVPGPVADLLRLNTGVAPTAPASASRLGLLGGDPAGYPNGRRLFDDVFDVALRLVAGGVLAGPPFSTSGINSRLGDGVNVNDAPYRTTFPYLASAPSGRNRRHIDPGEPGCTAGVGASCLP